jgi:hypothetical protein
MSHKLKSYLTPSVIGFTFFALTCLVFVQGRTTYGIPAFARKYQTSCSTCHNNPPELNDFGWAFKKNGFKFPKDDEDFVKEPQLKLGAPAYKKIFPKAIYPGEIPGTIPIGFRYEGYLNYRNRQPVALGFQPRVDLFAPDTFTIIAAGSLGDNLSWWVDDDVSAGGSGADGGLGDGYLKYNDLGHHLGLPKDALNVRIGQFELDLPFTQARTINLSGYDVYDEAAVAGDLGTTDNPFTFGEVQRGIEFGGYPNDGNFNWSVALTNGTNDAPPSSNGKNVFINVFQQFNLDRDRSQRKEVQAAGATGPHDHTSLRVGGFYDYGRNDLNTDDTLFPGFGVLKESYYRVGTYFRFKYQSRFELYGMGMYSHDNNLIPNEMTMVVDRGPAVNFSGGFVQAEYWAYPWLIPIMRYDIVNAPYDFFDGASKGFTRNRFSPGIQMLIRPNVKFNFEYNHFWAEPVPGETAFFTSNGFQGGVDFAF